MKKLRVTYNYHSLLHLDFDSGEYAYKKFELATNVGDAEAEDCLQEFAACSNPSIQKKMKNFIMLKLLSVLCTTQIYLAGDVMAKDERGNIYCITDVEVLE